MSSKHTPFWVVCTEPGPGMEFIECENADRRGVTVGTWEKREDGYWQLGPFYEQLAESDLLAACEAAEGVLTEPGIMDVDEWKAWQKRTIVELRAAIARARGES